MEPEFLKDMPKKGPFEVPEGYFEKLQGEITGRATGETRLPTLPPAPLAQAVFQLPPAYFNTLPARIAARTSMAGTRYRYYKTAAAACIALLLGVFSVIQVEKKSDPADSIVNIANFDEEILVQEYLESVPPSGEEQYGELESYFLNQVDESLLLQEL